MRPTTARRPRTLALGAWLAARGALAVAGLVLASLGALASIVAAFAIARHGGQGAARVPTLASEGIAWSAGMTLAFGVALRAIHRDRETGILALVHARGVSARAYVRGRVGGLVMVLAAALGGPTLIAGLAATSAGGATIAVVSSSTAALAYVVAFAATIGPIAMACLGARTRAGGYLTLLAVLVVPELAAPWTSALLPSGWHELTSIPAALDAVRAGVTWPLTAQAGAARALAGLAAVISLSLLVTGARARHAEAEPLP
jgi:hypothetical protein